jgi:hypothetical protein
VRSQIGAWPCSAKPQTKELQMTATTADSLKGEDIIDSRNIIEAAQALRDEIEAEPRDLDTGRGRVARVR